MKNKSNYQLAASFFLLIFAFLGYTVKFYPQWVAGFDQLLTKLVRAPYPAWHPFYLWVTKFGNPLTIAIIALVFLFIFLWGKRYAEAIWLACGVIGVSAIFNPLIKLLFMRERPTLPHLVEEFSYSFPSGHSTGSMILYGTLIVLLPLFFKNKSVLWLGRIILGGLILLIGLSRIYVGVHFPSDVTGGFCLGLAWLLFSYPYFAEKRFTWRFTGKQR